MTVRTENHRSPRNNEVLRCNPHAAGDASLRPLSHGGRSGRPSQFGTIPKDWAAYRAPLDAEFADWPQDLVEADDALISQIANGHVGCVPPWGENEPDYDMASFMLARFAARKSNSA